MPRYFLPIVVCVAILNGCVATPDCSPRPPTYGEKDLQHLRTCYRKPFPGRISEAADWAQTHYKADYRALVVAATYKDRRALSTLMSFSMDGAAGEEHSNTLGLLLGGLGDDFFSSVLKSQSRTVRQLVLQSLDLYAEDYAPSLKAHSPKTFGISGG